MDACKQFKNCCGTSQRQKSLRHYASELFSRVMFVPLIRQRASKTLSRNKNSHPFPTMREKESLLRKKLTLHSTEDILPWFTALLSLTFLARSRGDWPTTGRYKFFLCLPAQKKKIIKNCTWHWTIDTQWKCVSTTLVCVPHGDVVMV